MLPLTSELPQYLLYLFTPTIIVLWCINFSKGSHSDTLHQHRRLSGWFMPQNVINNFKYFYSFLPSPVFSFLSFVFLFKLQFLYFAAGLLSFFIQSLHKNIVVSPDSFQHCLNRVLAPHPINYSVFPTKRVIRVFNALEPLNGNHTLNLSILIIIIIKLLH